MRKVEVTILLIGMKMMANSKDKLVVKRQTITRIRQQNCKMPSSMICRSRMPN